MIYGLPSSQTCSMPSQNSAKYTRFLWKVFNDDEDSSSKARYEMKTQMLLVRELSPLQLSAAKKMKTEELAKENEEYENASRFEVAEKGSDSCTCCDGGGYSRFLANQRCGYWAET